MSILYSPATLGPLTLQNHLVMAPMTRNRAIGNVPNELMAEYYGQRASAGLIVTEGTTPSPNGLGYPRIPGIFQYYSVAEDELAKVFAGKMTAQQGADSIAAAWEKITDQIGRDAQLKLYRASLDM